MQESISTLLSDIDCTPLFVPGKIDALSNEEFRSQFRSLLDTDIARKNQNIAYMWVTETPIPRLKGSSCVIYIGKTVYSLRERHRQWAKIESEGFNWLRHNHIIETFGAIQFIILLCKNGISPKNLETNLLDKYLKLHLENPPMNSTSR
ncbi:MAG: hypothetical protein NTX45_21795 [Proteobacteria bacterium]|nr:hypothetical protein [Pseudomonadota bacterium]